MKSRKTSKCTKRMGSLKAGAETAAIIYGIATAFFTALESLAISDSAKVKWSVTGVTVGLAFVLGCYKGYKKLLEEEAEIVAIEAVRTNTLETTTNVLTCEQKELADLARIESEQKRNSQKINKIEALCGVIVNQTTPPPSHRRMLSVRTTPIPSTIPVIPEIPPIEETIDLGKSATSTDKNEPEVKENSTQNVSELPVMDDKEIEFKEINHANLLSPRNNSIFSSRLSPTKEIEKRIADVKNMLVNPNPALPSLRLSR